jgi:hypothetical protein
MIFMFGIPAAMTIMTAMKKMHKRTKEKYKIRQRAEKVRSMLSPEEKRSDGGKSDKH